MDREILKYYIEEYKEDFDRIHRNHSIFIEAVERYDTDTLREAFHLNFDDVGKDIESFWLQ